MIAILGESATLMLCDLIVLGFPTKFSTIRMHIFFYYTFLRTPAYNFKTYYTRVYTHVHAHVHTQVRANFPLISNSCHVRGRIGTRLYVASPSAIADGLSSHWPSPMACLVIGHRRRLCLTVPCTPAGTLFLTASVGAFQSVPWPHVPDRCLAHVSVKCVRTQVRAHIP